MLEFIRYKVRKIRGGMRALKCGIRGREDRSHVLVRPCGVLQRRLSCRADRGSGLNGKHDAAGRQFALGLNIRLGMCLWPAEDLYTKSCVVIVRCRLHLSESKDIPLRPLFSVVRFIFSDCEMGGF